MTDPTSTNRQNTLRTLAMLCGLSALAIIIRALFSPWQPTFPDSFTYLKLSESISKGSLFIEQWARGENITPKPLYSLLITGMAFIFEEREIAATLFSVVCGGFLIIPVFYLGKAFFGRTTAWIGIILLLFSPSMIQFSGWILTESIFTFLFYVCLSLTAVMLMQGRTTYGWILLGVLSGLVLLTREVGIFVFPMIILWTVFQKILIQRVGFLKAARWPVFLILGFLMIYLPNNMVYKYVRLAQQQSMATTVVTTEDSDKVSLGVRLGTRLAGYIYRPDLKNPEDYERINAGLTADGSMYAANVEMKRASNAHLFDVFWQGKSILWDILRKGTERYASVFLNSFSIILIIFLIIGLFSYLVRKEGVERPFYMRFFLLFWIIGYFAILLISGSAYFAFSEFELERYLTPLFPIFFLWVGYGVETASRLLPRYIHGLVVSLNELSWQQGITVLLTLVILVTFLPQVRYLRLYDGNRESLSKRAGEEIRRRISHPPLLMARNPSIPYYAEGDFLLTPYAPYDQVVGFARKKGVDFIVIGRGDRRPLLENLLLINAPKPGVKLEFGVRDRRDPDRLMIAIYRVL